ncbi:Methyltransferase domain-containing protein [Oribacterium sp. KHPX15]|uniref:class I SAM-dependent methyltransferase n=1 Tax=Oribacterium sp. KHPX15 TaxID=1855342 RepID=UPI00089D8BCE|nr:class I SAM-dependent methyltransferase [Oribacterium sp. KHPX15]SEA83374.1 Methyltransferase domain-containing protein [Oribacterium sp. KHPX15]
MENIYKKVEKCPWCGQQGKTLFSEKAYNVLKCKKCGLVWSDTVLSEHGLKEYWTNYESEVHSADAVLTEQRKIMYRNDFDFVKPFIDSNSKVLDVGCGDGGFLDLFKEYGCSCEGTEFGEEAYRIAGRKYPMYFGELADIVFEKKYDVVLFRGTIQYLLKPQESLKKATELLNRGGIIFIYMVNSDSICFKLFKDKFRLPVSPTDYYMFNKPLLNDLMESMGMQLMVENMPYLGTPYENWREDILEVAEAIRKSDTGDTIEKKSPPFFDTMINLIYKKK